MIKGLVGSELDAEIAVALDLDSVIGLKAEWTTSSRDVRKAMGSTLHVEQVAPKTPATTVFRGSTSMLARANIFLYHLFMLHPSRETLSFFLKRNGAVFWALMLTY